MKNLMDIMREAQKMKAVMQRIQEEAAAKTVTATAGGGVVTVDMNGAMEVTGVRIDPSVIDPSDPQTLEDLVRAAVNEAGKKSREMIKAELSKVTGGLPLPGLF